QAAAPEGAPALVVAAPQAAPAPIAEPPSAPEAPAVVPGDAVSQKVLEIIAAKTGYPPEMLDLDLDLEADLGVDTVKQAETFASVREAYGIERDAQLKLRDFPTLRHVIGFVYDRRPDLRPAAPVAAAPVQNVAPAPAAKAEPAPKAQLLAAAAADDGVPAKVLAILAEKTGYPPEMLDLDLDLEADLGVDTVKQAETFAAVREAYSIPRDAQLKLRDFPTIRHVIQFVYDRRPAASPAEAAPPPAAAAAEEPAATILRRVPVPVLRPPIALCKDTGVKLGRVAVAADGSGVAEALAQQLRARGAEVLVVDPKDVAAAGDLDGLFWLPALDDEGALFALTPESWQQGVARRVKSLASVARVLHPQLGKGRFLIAGTRMGGLLGAGPDGATAPMGGAVSGFVKALARERAEALIKVVDFEQARGPESIAAALIEEALYDPGAVEIGRRGEERFSLAAREAEAPAGVPAKLGPDATFVITGAAGSIVSAITCDLAKGGGSFWLVDRFPEPDLADPDLEKIGSDRDGLKRSLIERAQARGEKVTPVAIERELARIERLAAGAQAIRAIQAAGGTAHWAQADLCDAAAVAQALSGVPRADVLLHCAGLEISRFLPDKTDEEFARVLDVKANGFFHVLHALRSVPIGAVVTFGSIAGRFGNAGQTDYSAANDLLAKCLAGLRRERPEIQGIHLDWTAWAQIGMASRGSIPKMMEVAGIEMLPPRDGLRAIRRELTAGTRGEVIIAGKLGVLLEERDPDGGLDRAKPDLSGRGPMIGRVVSLTLHGGLTVETTLDPKEQPFLHDHQIDGTAVLPGVMGVEAFAELATLLAPGYRVAAVEQVQFLSAFKFYRGEPRTLRLTALVGVSGGELIAECALIGERQLVNQPATQRTHFTARVRLARGAPEQVKATHPQAHDGALPARDIYGVYFHGPAYQVLERAWNDNGSTVGLLPADLPQDHAADRPLVLDPRLIELCFQTAGLREMRAKGQMGLPQSVAGVEKLGDGSAAQGRVEAVVVDDGAGGFDAQVVDEAGRALLRLHGYRTATLPAPLDRAFLERLATL
ncbi:MAG TPA: SDR family oxidoreductase, partial [Myxococcales bacterium]|nr:SDR family oxidoreductase [Myxococcales bacterium]